MVFFNRSKLCQPDVISGIVFQYLVCFKQTVRLLKFLALGFMFLNLQWNVLLYYNIQQVRSRFFTNSLEYEIKRNHVFIYFIYIISEMTPLYRFGK